MKKSINLSILLLSLVFSIALYSKDVFASPRFVPNNDLEDRPYQITKDLYKGMKNDPDVKALQKILKFEGLYKGKISGNFDKKTAKAVGELQKKYEIESESKRIGRIKYPYVGPNTRVVINILESLRTAGVTEYLYNADKRRDIIKNTLRNSKKASSTTTIKSLMSNIRSLAEIFYGSNGNYGNPNVPNDCNNNVFNDNQIKKGINQIIDIINKSNIDVRVISCKIDSSGQKWALSVSKLPKDDGIPPDGWCVDNSGETTAGKTAILGICKQLLLR